MSVRRETTDFPDELQYERIFLWCLKLESIPAVLNQICQFRPCEATVNGPTDHSPYRGRGRIYRAEYKPFCVVIIPFYLPFPFVDHVVSDQFHSVYQTQPRDQRLEASVLFCRVYSFL